LAITATYQAVARRDRAGNLHHPGLRPSAELVDPAGIVITGRSFRRLHGLRDRRVNP
jgi:hypothetical protein